jgi:hypothetical protein
MNHNLERIWFTGCAVIFLFAAMQPNIMIRILSYGRKGSADIPRKWMTFLRWDAAIAGISAIYVVIFGTG